MPRYLMQISYDGTRYHGWQKQQNGLAIQEVLETTMLRFCECHIPLTAAGRTDTGVHALAQYAHFDYSGSMQPQQMLLAFRRYLPYDIKVNSIQRVSPSLSARYQAYQRSYRYILAKERTPFNRLYTGFLPHIKPSLAPMQTAAKLLMGSHDFSSFGRANPEIPNHVCDIQLLDITETEDSFIFHITADRFLHNMVRRIVGTLANIAHFSLETAIINAILQDACPRQNIVTTAPASGLYLIDVKYPGKYLDETYVSDFDAQNEVNNEI